MRRDPTLLRPSSPVFQGWASSAAAVLVSAVIAATVLWPAALAFGADPTTAAQEASAATPGKATCAISDSRLDHITSLVTVDDGFVVVEDGANNPGDIRLYHLSPVCGVSDVATLSQDPVDMQDMVFASDDALWIADVGDPDKNRDRVALWRIPAGSNNAERYRLSYPDGPRDAAALLVDGDDTPLIIGKAGPTVGIYRPAGEMKANEENAQPMKKVGEFTAEKTGTSNPFAAVGQTLVTGAARNVDGTKVTIRTYSDAYEFDVTDGDVLAAITSGNYRITPLPDEPQGEAISYSDDGGTFFTVGQQADDGAKPKILSYTPTAPDEAGGAPSDPADADGSDSGPSWFDKLTYSDMTRLVAAVGVVGLVLAIAGIVGIRRSRRRREEEEDEEVYGADLGYGGEPPPGGGRGAQYPPTSGPAGPGPEFSGGYGPGYGPAQNDPNQFGPGEYGGGHPGASPGGGGYPGQQSVYGRPVAGYDAGYPQGPGYQQGYPGDGVPAQGYPAQDAGYAGQGYGGHQGQDYSGQGYDQYGQQQYGHSPQQYGYDQQQHGYEQQYAAPQYAPQDNAGQQYGQPYPGQQYGQQYPDQQYPGQSYPDQQYAGQQYPDRQHQVGQEYGQPDHPGYGYEQQYGGQPYVPPSQGGQYGGTYAGYEDDFDPMQQDHQRRR